MKKTVALMLILSISLISLIGCTKRIGVVEVRGQITVVVETAEKEYQVYTAMLEDIENKQNGLMCVLLHMSEREENKLPLTIEENRFGSYVAAIGGISQKADEGLSIIVYTSTASDSYGRASVVEYGEMTLYQSGLGITGMSAYKDSVILFRLEKHF